MYHVGETCELLNYKDEHGQPAKVYFVKRNRTKIKVKLLTTAKKRRGKMYPIGDVWDILEIELKPKIIVTEEEVEDDGKFTCKICYTNNIDYISSVCGHCICHNCKTKLRKFNCPFCRKSWRGKLVKIHNN